MQGAIANNANVEFQQLSDGSYTGARPGFGQLTKSGAGMLTLSGVNTYLGGTTVSEGVLRGTTASLQGAIVNNASVEFDQALDGVYAGQLSGSGGIVKSGTGH